MSKRKEPHYKIDRRLGCNLWGRPKSPFNKREYAPGEHGQRKGNCLILVSSYKLNKSLKDIMAICLKDNSEGITKVLLD